MGNRAAARSRQRTALVRQRFVQRAEPSAPDPPLARFLRGGRGGEVRLKVYLTQLWIGSGGSHDVSFAPSTYARLLGLDEPFKNGARRVNDALDWLHGQGFINLERRPGREPVATLLRDDGSRGAYKPPGAAAKDPETNKTMPGNIYFRVRPSFWSKGWAAYLRAPAAAMLLVLLARARSKREDGIRISPSQLSDWYAISDDTRRRGIEILEDVGLVCGGRRTVDSDFEFRRVRNTYAIDPALLDCDIESGAAGMFEAIADLLDDSNYEAWSNYAHSRIVAATRTAAAT